MDNDEFLGRYCENCHIATGLCECTDCDECPNYIEDNITNITKLAIDK